MFHQFTVDFAISGKKAPVHKPKEGSSSLKKRQLIHVYQGGEIKKKKKTP